jgi:negative regulator of sigma E activity
MTDKHTSNSLSASSAATFGYADLQQREAYREQLSAMMDGTLSADESRFLLRRMQHDAELAGCWERWQLFGDAMRGQTGNALPADFSRRVSRAIAADIAANVAAQASFCEPAVASNDVAAVAWRQRLRWGGGAALAASVAIAALISTRNLSLDSNPLLPAGSTMTAVQSSATAPTPTAATASALPSATSASAEPASTQIPPNHLPKKMASIALVSMDTSFDITKTDSPSASTAEATVVTAALATTALATTGGAKASPTRERRDVRPSLPSSVSRNASRPVAVATASTRNDAAQTIVDPFGRQALDLTTKPWPRALLPESATVGGVTVDYSVGSPGVHPSFQPRVEATLAPAQSDVAPAPSHAPGP